MDKHSEKSALTFFSALNFKYKYFLLKLKDFKLKIILSTSFAIPRVACFTLSALHPFNTNAIQCVSTFLNSDYRPCTIFNVDKSVANIKIWHRHKVKSSISYFTRTMSIYHISSIFVCVCVLKGNGKSKKAQKLWHTIRQALLKAYVGEKAKMFIYCYCFSLYDQSGSKKISTFFN